MTFATSGESKLLTEDELEPIRRSHYPAIEQESRDDLVQLARWLRQRRARAGTILRDRRRVRRGKAPARAGEDGQASERGLSAKKQIYARALRRVNGRLQQMADARKRAGAARNLQAALERRRHRQVHHPEAGRTAGQGLQPNENAGDTVRTDPREIGRVSQFVRDAQVRRDTRAP
ncbi:hypothetical protein [Marinivivus vitaminiproducens]|uniref:hypothetical protein n=1 Tax=Marinivivus vitaminiproducens TaxID=3035935 RepID=UPI0027A68EAB|nr:hypothetical protein P4R82_15810 [Geminicoccaceae bacterium SCSIO 64248]